MNPLRQCWHAAKKIFDLPRRRRAVRDRRTDPSISGGVLTTSRFLALARWEELEPLWSG